MVEPEVRERDADFFFDADNLFIVIFRKNETAGVQLLLAIYGDEKVLQEESGKASKERFVKCRMFV